MLPSPRFQRLGALRGEQRDGGLTGAGGEDAADLREGNTGDFARRASSGRGGEEEFVVFSAVEGLGQGCGGVDGQGRGIDFGGYTGLGTEVGEIGG